MKGTRCIIGATTTILVVFFSLTVFAAIPQTINYQGYLRDAAGNPVNGTVSMVFSIYTQATGGTALWSESRSVAVDKGAFNVVLGSVTPLTLPFDQQYYIGIQVESDAEMTPRPALTSSAYTLKAKSVEAGAVTGNAIAAGAVTDDKISGTITGSKLGSHSHAGGDITGAVASAGNADTLGSKLPGNGSGNIPLSNGVLNASLNAEMIGGYKVADLDLRYRQISPIQLPGSNIYSTVTSTENIGMYTSITIGADGLPIISYYDATNQDLKVLKCGNAACSAGNTITTGDTAGMLYSSIIIGTDGMPVISYLYNGPSGGQLNVLKCGDATCSSGNTIVTADEAAQVGWFPSIAISSLGTPVISYYDFTNEHLKVLLCGNESCSAGNLIQTVDASQGVGQGSTIALGTGGFPVVTYQDNSNFDLKVLTCNDAFCTSRTTTTMDSLGNVGGGASVAIGGDGLPVISYYDTTNGDLKVAKCGNVSCTAGNILATVDGATSNVGDFTSITIGTDGLPVISYRDVTNTALKFVKCGNASCSAGNMITTVDGPGISGINAGQFTSITMGTDGLPIISYYDATNTDLKIVKCANQFCSRYWSRR